MAILLSGKVDFRTWPITKWLNLYLLFLQFLVIKMNGMFLSFKGVILPDIFFSLITYA